MRRASLVSVVVLVLWGGVAVAAIASVNATPRYWSAPVGFLVVAAAVVAAWVMTDRLLRVVGLSLPYRSE